LQGFTVLVQLWRYPLPLQEFLWIQVLHKLPLLLHLPTSAQQKGSIATLLNMAVSAPLQANGLLRAQVRQ
jgi:hypothetical protein